MTDELKERWWENNIWMLDDEDAHSEIPDKGERLVVLLKEMNFTYAQIQKRMGNVSKKWIRQVLRKWAPELIEN